MIGVIELSGGGSESEGESLRVAVLGAVRRAGRPVTPSVRQLAARLAAAWAGERLNEMTAILVKLGLSPDDVLPPDDAALAEVMEHGERADADSRTPNN